MARAALDADAAYVDPGGDDPAYERLVTTLKRYGVFGEAFYEKDAPGFTPRWVKTFPFPRCSQKVNNFAPFF